jgi:hypothetical protein
MLKQLLEACGLSALPEFRAQARYSRAMDAINFVREDCSYTSERVDNWLTIFWDPTVSRPVGFRLKGIRHLFLRVREVKEAVGTSEEDYFGRVIRLLELVVTIWGDGITAQAVRASKYRMASDLAREAWLPKDDIEQIRLAAEPPPAEPVEAHAS